MYYDHGNDQYLGLMTPTPNIKLEWLEASGQSAVIKPISHHQTTK